MNTFTYALEQRNLEELRKYPKADLHNHFVLGGNRMFIYQKTRKKIGPLVNPLSSMDEMNQWSQKYIDQDFNSTAMRKFLIRATFEQAKEDGVTVLEIGEDVWGLNATGCIHILRDFIHKSGVFLFYSFILKKFRLNRGWNDDKI